jgi:hypothetical protein
MVGYPYHEILHHRYIRHSFVLLWQAGVQPSQQEGQANRYG